MDYITSLLKSQRIANIRRPALPNTRSSLLVLAFSSFLLATFVTQWCFGRDSYGDCQTRCNLAAMACFAGAGFQFGAVTFGIGTPAALLTCAGIQGTCMAACAG